MTPDLTDFHTAWHWLHDHPYFFMGGETYNGRSEPGFTESLDIEIVKVDPELDEVSGTDAHNVMTRVWLECGPWYEPGEDERHLGMTGSFSHDHELDTGGATFEEAICNLAALVLGTLGDYPTYRHCHHCLRRLPAPDAQLNEAWYCSPGCKLSGPHTPPWLQAAATETE